MILLEELDANLIEFDIQSSRSRQLFKDKASLKEFYKNENLFLEGDHNQYEYLLLSGVLHKYHISEKGDCITTGFYMAKTAITPHFARVKDNKSIFSVQALTDCLLAEIPVEEMNTLRSTLKEFQLFGQKAVQSELSNIFFFESVCRSASAKERLLILREHYPNLENLVPHHAIASFLGITQVSFSRLRHELSAK